MDIDRVDLLLQYSLAVAGEQDEYYDRSLGPIHLVKYAYLGDLANAERNQGETFTGVKWQFYKFGPWSLDIYNRIEPALTAVGAERTEMSHPKYEDDFVRWRLCDDEMISELARKLPFQVCIAIQNAVRGFGSDTPSLLNHVYLTLPMLRAAPGDFLDFSPLEKIEPEHPSRNIEVVEASPRHRQKLNELRARIQAKLKKKKTEKKLVNPEPPPRYDETFLEGKRWLDGLAGSPTDSGKHRVRFSDDVWKSRARFDPEIP